MAILLNHFALLNKFQVDVWGRPAREAIDVMVSPQQLGDIFKFSGGEEYHV